MTIWPDLGAGVQTFIANRPDPIAITSSSYGASLPVPLTIGGVVLPGTRAFVEVYIAFTLTRTAGTGTINWQLQLNGSPCQIHTEGVSDVLSGSVGSAGEVSVELSSNYSGADVPFGPTSAYVPTDAYVRSETLGWQLKPGNWVFELAAWTSGGTATATITNLVAVARVFGLTGIGTVPIPPPIQPITDVTLDDFNRADNASLGANYTVPMISTASLSPRVVSNQCGGNASATGDSYSSAYWVPATFGPNCEVWFEVGSGSPQEGIEIFGRMSGLDGSPSGYSLDTNYNGTHTYQIARYDNGTYVPLGAPGTVTPALGDRIYLVAQGNILYAYHRPSGSLTRNLIAQVTDSTYAGAGSVGLSIEAGATRINQWGASTT